MTSLQQLNQYLARLETRLRLLAAARGAASTILLALVLTVALVWIGNRFAFAQGVVLPLRVALFACVGTALALLLVWPLSRLSRRRVLGIAERGAPEFQQRLLTVHEKSAAGDPWSELLAEDALTVARQQPAERFASTQQLYGFGGGLVVAAIALLWLITAGPGYWGYGAALLWTGSADTSKRPLYDISVSPGNKTIRRKTDQIITAKLNGFSADHVNLYVKYGSSLKWDRTTMQGAGDGDQYRFLFAGLSDQVEYYVAANHAVSQHFKIGVRDLPGVLHVKVALNFPAGLGLENVVLEPSGDIRAVMGTTAQISILTDRPLPHGQLIFNDGKKLDLAAGEGNWLSATTKIEKDGSYHVAAIDNGETIRISDDYIVEAKKDEPPSVKILKPGNDPKVSPIEELPVTVTASDDYGVQDLQLHYSVNGGPEQTASLLKNKGAKEADGKMTLYFENFKVAPGDMVSFYATAKDAKTTAHSDIVFAQAEPFDYKFSQSQQAGGGGGGGGGMANDSNDISKRQKQVIAATFNEINDKSKPRAVVADDAKFLSELQAKLGAQAKTLSDRMSSREMGASGQQFQQFSQLMTQASSDMNTAADSLKPGRWNDALAPEQKALTSLLRADALFRDIQIAYGQMGGGAGNSSGAQRDLARMLDLELDTSKNQYETGQTPQPEASSAEKSKALDDAFEKLQALARRQQELAAQRAQQQAFEQRWEEEQLRREAEELRQELQKMAQDSQGSQGQQGQQGQQSGQQQGQGGQSGQSQSNGSRGGQQSASAQGGGGSQRQSESLQRAGSSLTQAEEEMRKAAGNNDASARDRAAAKLREAQQEMSGMMRDQSGKSVAEMQAQAQRLAQAQKSVADRMKQLYGADSSRSLRNTFGQGDEGEMPEMNDPNSRRYGYGFRRPYNANPTPGREATETEKSLAGEKERLASELQQLEQQMQAQSQNLAGTRPDAATKLSRALSDAEGKELALRMQKNAEWMRQGYGDRNLRMEDSVTAGMDQLSRDLKGVRDTLNGSPTGAGSQGEKTARALAEVQDLRLQLERQQAARKDGPPQGSSQQGSNSSQQAGSQAGSSQANGGSPQSGAPPSSNGGSRQAGDDTSRTGNGQLALGRPGLNGGGNGSDWNRDGLNRESVQTAIRQLNTLRAETNPNDRALYGSIDGALGNLHHLTAAQDGLLDTRLSQNALSSLERLEIELSKRVGQESSAGTRTTAHETSPEKYREAVAGYFRKLSQTGNESSSGAPK